MSVIINASTTYSYDINTVKRLYALKQSNQTEGSDSITYTRNSATEIDRDGLNIVDIPSVTAARQYYNGLIDDLFSGRITQEEYMSHLEDIYYARCSMHYGVNYEDIPEEEKLKEYCAIIGEATNSLINYFMKQNLQEWETMDNDCTLYYNVEHHYQCEEAKPAFYDGLRAFTEKLGFDTKRLDARQNDPILSVHGKISIAMSYSRSGANKFIDLDILPPRDFKIALSTQYSPYWARVWCGNEEYYAEIPFSWQDHVYQVSLSDVLAAFDIPEEYQSFINNFILIHRDIAWSDPYRPADIFAFNPKIVEAVKAYEKMVPDAF